MSAPRVLCWPPAHPYVDRLYGRVAQPVRLPEDEDGDELLHDLTWLRHNAHRVDIAHLHFGQHTHPISRVVEVVATLRACAIPVVWTVHQVRNPALEPEQDRTLELLDAASPHVNRVTTFTPSASATLSERLDRPVEVIPHGPLVPRTRRRSLRNSRALGPARPARGHVLVVVGPGRRSTSLDDVVAAAAGGRRRSLRILLHRSQRADHADAVEAAADSASVDVALHDGLTQGELEHELLDAAALLLPTLWGTHSGLAEMAADLGIPVVPTTCSHVDEQVPTDLRVAVDGARLSSTDLAAVFDAPSLPEAPRPESRDRAARAFLAGHEHLYRHSVGLTTMGHTIDLDSGGSPSTGRRA